MSIACVLALLAGYVFQVNSLTATAYHVTTQERAVKQLAEQQKNLEGSRGNTLSFGSMAQLAHQLKFERAGQVSYIQAGSGPVAQNFQSNP